MESIKRIVLGGSYTDKKQITIDASYIGNFGYDYEVMVLDADGEEIASASAKTEQEAIEKFDSFVVDYAGDLQKAFYNKLVPGKRYTIVRWDECGFPTAERITYYNMELCTYAQHDDAIRLYYIPFRGRKMQYDYFRNSSVLVFEGWQKFKDSDLYDITEKPDVITKKGKYRSFDAQLIEDTEKLFKSPVVIYKNYRTGKFDGRLYA